MPEKNQNTPKKDEEETHAMIYVLDEEDHIEDTMDKAQKKRNPFIKDPAAYAAYRNRRSRNRLT